jgi:hypothetical protein
MTQVSPGQRTPPPFGAPAGPPSSRVTPITLSPAPASPCSGRRATTLTRQVGAVSLLGLVFTPRAAGRAPMRGLAQPSAEVVSACLLPRVWVWGFWFGFALRRVALLCGVFVHLHLALFPAGGPFLPSLSVNQ